MANLIISGVFKGGTTSLYTYLSWHPEICCSSKKETGFFYDEVKKISDYDNYFRHCDGAEIKLEATPGYLYGEKKIASRIKNYLDDPKIIILLRNPTERFCSDYRHLIKTMLIPKDYDFSKFLDSQLNYNSNMRLENNELGNSLSQGYYYNYLPSWFEIFKDSIRVYFLDNLKENPREILLDICQWMNIDDSIYDDKSFSVENKSVSYRYKFLQDIAYWIFNKFEFLFRQNYKLKRSLRSLYYFINSKDIRDQIGGSDKQKLDDIYKDYNLKLKQFLEAKGISNLPSWLKERGK